MTLPQILQSESNYNLFQLLVSPQQKLLYTFVKGRVAYEILYLFVICIESCHTPFSLYVYKKSIIKGAIFKKTTFWKFICHFQIYCRKVFLVFSSRYISFHTKQNCKKKFFKIQTKSLLWYLLSGIYISNANLAWSKNTH